VAKLYVSLIGLTIVFACAMSFATLAVYDNTWWPGIVAAALVVVVLGGSRAAITSALGTLAGGYRKTAQAAGLLFGSLCGVQFFVMALITWALGKRVVGENNAYLTLGLLIFLGLLGIGIQGVVAMVGWFAYVRNQAVVVPAREAAALRVRGQEAQAGHTVVPGH
jgi:hypothetical protein